MHHKSLGIYFGSCLPSKKGRSSPFVPPDAQRNEDVHREEDHHIHLEAPKRLRQVTRTDRPRWTQRPSFGGFGKMKTTNLWKNHGGFKTFWAKAPDHPTTQKHLTSRKKGNQKQLLLCWSHPLAPGVTELLPYHNHPRVLFRDMSDWSCRPARSIWSPADWPHRGSLEANGSRKSLR